AGSVAAQLPRGLHAAHRRRLPGAQRWPPPAGLSPHVHRGKKQGMTTESLLVPVNPPVHPGAVLLGAQAGAVLLPVCDHYSGVEVRMKKSLALQAEMAEEFGACVFDVTLDCEDGAPVGGEAEHAALVTELALGVAAGMRVGVRVHPVDHPSFAGDVATIAGRAGRRLSHLMVPKVESVDD